MRILLLWGLYLISAPLAAQDTRPISPGHRVLAADRGTGKLAIVGKSGTVEWEFSNRHDVHDLWMLPNGNILTLTSPTTVVEINPQKQIVWKYESRPKPGYTGRVEVHAVQRLADGNTMIAESGNTRIIEVDPQGRITRTIPLQVGKPNAHRDTRMVRKLKNGHYLVCQESDGCVKEYDADGRVVWQYKLDLAGRPRAAGHGPEGHGVEVFGAVRLPNGHTLIAGGNNNRVIEVTPEGKIVWSVDQKELPGITLAWVTTLHVLPNGNIVIGNCHAGPTNPQLIEVTRDKKVVWTFNNQKLFGNNLAAAMILDTECIR
ncbi:MAG: PQQ-binding-like beta-propeller repeat protein [Bacteroidales bacterium]|nr:PQQ-binding-like beta-propeller repeat protein [Bacteroidales bacterium]